MSLATPSLCHRAGHDCQDPARSTQSVTDVVRPLKESNPQVEPLMRPSQSAIQPCTVTGALPPPRQSAAPATLRPKAMRFPSSGSRQDGRTVEIALSTDVPVEPNPSTTNGQGGPEGHTRAARSTTPTCFRVARCNLCEKGVHPLEREIAASGCVGACRRALWPAPTRGRPGPRWPGTS